MGSAEAQQAGIAAEFAVNDVLDGGPAGGFRHRDVFAVPASPERAGGNFIVAADEGRWRSRH